MIFHKQICFYSCTPYILQWHLGIFKDYSSMAMMPPTGAQLLLHLDPCAPSISDWLTLLMETTWSFPMILGTKSWVHPISNFMRYLPLPKFVLIDNNAPSLPPTKVQLNATIWRCHSWLRLLPSTHTHSESLSVFCIQMSHHDSSSSSHLSVLPLRLKAATMSCSESVAKQSTSMQ